MERRQSRGRRHRIIVSHREGPVNGCPCQKPRQGMNGLWAFLKAGYALGRACSESARISLNKWFYFIHLQHQFGHVSHRSCRVNVGEFYKFYMGQNF